MPYFKTRTTTYHSFRFANQSDFMVYKDYSGNTKMNTGDFTTDGLIPGGGWGYIRIIGTCWDDVGGITVWIEDSVHLGNPGV